MASVAAVFLFAGSGVTRGDYKKFSYRGREVLSQQMLGAVPARVSKEGIEVQIAGVSLDGDNLTFNFGLASQSKPVGVVVEDVSSATAIRLVEQYPSANTTLGEDGRWVWFGQGGQKVLDRETTGWIFEDGESSFVFRFFVELDGGGTVEIFQPAVFSKEFKAKIRGVEGAKKTEKTP